MFLQLVQIRRRVRLSATASLFSPRQKRRRLMTFLPRTSESRVSHVLLLLLLFFTIIRVLLLLLVVVVVVFVWLFVVSRVFLKNLAFLALLSFLRLKIFHSAEKIDVISVFLFSHVVLNSHRHL